MPIPRLLKRLSEKSLRRRAQTTDEIKQVPYRDSEVIPPLPNYTTSSSAPSLHHESTFSQNRSATMPPNLSIPNGVEYSISSAPVNGNFPTQRPDDDRNLTQWSMIKNPLPPVASNAYRALANIESQVVRSTEIKTNNALLITAAAEALTSTGGIQAIENGINHFMKGSEVLMKALDEVAKLHPFVGVAVLAFKTVWTLEMKRRENDKRIIALYVEMRDMMTIIIQLKDVKDSVTDMAPDGTTIAGRMKQLSQTVAADIKSCANTCDTYLKKKLVAKVIKGPLWEGQLLKFVKVFAGRRKELGLALSIHTAREIGMANQKLDDIGQRMELMMEMFKKLVPPEQMRVAQLVEDKGGPDACQGNMSFLKDLVERSQATQSRPNRYAGGPMAKKEFDESAHAKNELDDVLEELHTDVEKAIKDNMEVFTRKFDIQTQQIKALERTIKQETDRVINTINAGPHDRITDPDVSKMWKEMNWRGSVKARHFVLTLRDYFQEKWGTTSPQQNTDDPVPISPVDSRKADDWALAYLNVVRLQPVTEAFDEDASGFITVQEVNAFTAACPHDWSLPHWLAYWAVGWNQTLNDYKQKIRDTLGKMFALLPNIKAENRVTVNDYLVKICTGIEELVESGNPGHVSHALQARFQSYVEAEEQRLKLHLEAIKYDIDGKDMVALITENGRIGKFILPLLYLLLERHFQIFRVARTRILHPDELWDAADTIGWIFDEVTERVDNLRVIFKHQKLDINQQFKTFANGLYEYWSDPSAHWTPSRVRQMEFFDYLYIESAEEGGISAQDICNYPLDQAHIDYTVYDTPKILSTPEVSVATHLTSVLGPWNGYIYANGIKFSGMISFTLSYKEFENDILSFEATEKSADSDKGRPDIGEFDFTINGTCSSSHVINISFTQKFPAHYSHQEWSGTFHPEAETITGTVNLKTQTTNAAHDLTFLLKRTPPEILRFFPDPSDLVTRKSTMLWKYALSAIRDQVQRKLCSWICLEERRKTCKQFVELYTESSRMGFGPGLSYIDTDYDDQELLEIKHRLTAADCRFYSSLAIHKIQATVIHNCYCDNCGGSTGESRIICLVCQAKDTMPWNTIDLCDTPTCITASAIRSDLIRPHVPTHDLIKVRRIVHIRQFGSMVRAAEAALKTARSLFEKRPKKGKRESVVSALGQKNRLICVICNLQVSQPCWYCVQCEDDLFICATCDSKGLEAFKDYKGLHQYHTHDLVRCAPQVKDPEAPSTEWLLNDIRERMIKLEQIVAGIGNINVGSPVSLSSLPPISTIQLLTPRSPS